MTKTKNQPAKTKAEDKKTDNKKAKGEAIEATPALSGTPVGSYQIRQSLGNSVKPVELEIYDNSGNLIKAFQLPAANAASAIAILRAGKAVYNTSNEYLIQTENTGNLLA